MRGNTKSWALGLREWLGCANGGNSGRRTWHSLFFSFQSNFFSAGFIRSSKLTLCEYPARCSFRRNRSTRSLSAALAQLHHAGAAYRRRLIAVALHTVDSALSCNPFALRMRSAYVEEAHLLMISSTWDVTDRSLVNRTPRIFSSNPLHSERWWFWNCPSFTFWNQHLLGLVSVELQII